MSDQETVASSETQTQTTEVQTLDDLVPEFHIEPQMETVQTKPESQVERSPTYETPDPIVDPEGFKKWATGTSGAVDSLKDELRQTVQALTNHAKAVQEKAEEKEIKEISGDMAKKIGDGTNPKMVEVALGLRYREDANFKKIWDNRAKNPTAFKKAMGIVGNDFKGMFSRTVDPQVAENVRALDQSISQASNKTKESLPVEQKYRDNFDQEWNKLLKSY